MHRAIALTALVMLINANASPASRRIEVRPLFWKGQDRPAFAVQCRNDSGATRSRMEYLLKSSAVRLDGVLHEKDMALGSFVGPVDVPAGVAFNQLVVLGESPGTEMDVAGDWTMTPWDLSLKPGPHRIAFRCWADWSADHEFVWGAAVARAQEPSPPPKYRMEIVYIFETKTPGPAPESILVIGNSGFRTLAALKRFVADLPPGASLEWSPGCEILGGELLLTSPKDMEEFKAFCKERGVAFVLHPAG